MAKGFKAGAGGYNLLNFKTAWGTATPENPKENMIWVSTDVPIKNWYFSLTRPEGLKEGDVWFQTGVASPAKFNLLKKNGVEIHPETARQYIGGELVEKTAKTYKSGKWINWIDWDRKLILNGVTQKDIRVTDGASRTDGDGFIAFQAMTYGNWAMYIADVDLTNIATLKIEGTFTVATEASSLRVWDNNAEPTHINSVLSAPLTQIGATLDVSTLSGLHKVGFTWESNLLTSVTNLFTEGGSE